jgi:hypothetical protein
MHVPKLHTVAYIEQLIVQSGRNLLWLMLLQQIEHTLIPSTARLTVIPISNTKRMSAGVGLTVETLVPPLRKLNLLQSPQLVRRGCLDDMSESAMKQSPRLVCKLDQQLFNGMNDLQTHGCVVWRVSMQRTG